MSVDMCQAPIVRAHVHEHVSGTHCQRLFPWSGIRHLLSLTLCGQSMFLWTGARHPLSERLPMDRCQASTVRVHFWGQPSHFPRAMQASSHQYNQRLRLWQCWWLSVVICEDCGGSTLPAVGGFAIFYHQTRRTLPRRVPIAGYTGDTIWTCRSAPECWLPRLWPGQTGNCLTSLKTPLTGKWNWVWRTPEWEPSVKCCENHLLCRECEPFLKQKPQGT